MIICYVYCDQSIVSEITSSVSNVTLNFTTVIIIYHFT